MQICNRVPDYFMFSSNTALIFLCTTKEKNNVFMNKFSSETQTDSIVIVIMSVGGAGCVRPRLPPPCLSSGQPGRR